jgi:hypothetical protein
VRPIIDHREFLDALRGLLSAYGVLQRATARALPPQLAAVAAVDPFTRVALERVGDPLVRWFGHGSQLPGVGVADGTLVFEPDGTIRFLEGAALGHECELPARWRSSAHSVGSIQGDKLELT